MSMANQLGALNNVNAFVSRALKQPMGDWADRLNSYATVLILAASSVLIGSCHIMGEPITCWVNHEFSGGWVGWINQYCYVQGTYYLHNQTSQALHAERVDRDARVKRTPINYYQWVPYIFALMALGFYFPRFVWKRLASYSGFDVVGAVKYVDAFWTSIKHNDGSFKSRIGLFEGRPAIYVWDGLRLARRKKSMNLPAYHVITTLLQTANAWLQWTWMNAMLTSGSYFWGISTLIDLWEGRGWQVTGTFPRVVWCDFPRLNQLGNQNMEHTFCVLTLNIYYEKICLFLWFWLLFVAIVSTVNTIYWLMSLCVTGKTKRMIECWLDTAEVEDSRSSRQQFFRALNKDGTFILEQIAMNLGEIPSSYLTIAMRNTCSAYLESTYDDSESIRYHGLGTDLKKGAKDV